MDELSHRLQETRKSAGNFDAEVADLTAKNAQREKDNAVLAAEIRKLRVENLGLSGVKDCIISSLESSPLLYIRNARGDGSKSCQGGELRVTLAELGEGSDNTQV